MRSRRRTSRFGGSYGWSEFAPYRAIVVTANAPGIPGPLVDQLADGGSLVLPVARMGKPEEQTLVRVRKQGGRVIEEEHGSCRFVPMIGKFGWEGD